jgi:hypothetical protein
MVNSTPVRVEIGDSWSEEATALGALVACMLDLEVEVQRAAIEATAKILGLDMKAVWITYRLAANILDEKAACNHDEIEFDGNCEVQRDTLVFHVNCRKCGRSGSSTVTAEEVMW